MEQLITEQGCEPNCGPNAVNFLAVGDPYVLVDGGGTSEGSAHMGQIGSSRSGWRGRVAGGPASGWPFITRT